jgi:hypothetical protein
VTFIRRRRLRVPEGQGFEELHRAGE